MDAQILLAGLGVIFIVLLIAIKSGPLRKRRWYNGSDGHSSGTPTIFADSGDSGSTSHHYHHHHSSHLGDIGGGHHGGHSSGGFDGGGGHH